MATLRIGKVRPSPKGTYDAALAYEAFDLVNWKGSSYLALTDVPVGQEPDISPSYWTIYAERGTDGQDGATGPQGPQGETGPQGPMGPTGPTGPEGPQGPQGPIGPEGPVGPQGPQGLAPSHEWLGSELRFKNPDGTWGNYVDLLGPVGPQGPQGIQGPVGPQGIEGPVGPEGPKGDKGDTGPRPSHSWSGTSVRFQNADGTWGTYVNLQGPVGPTGPQGIEGPTGPRPSHQWSGTSVRFQQSDGTWGSYVNLQGPQGIQGPKGDQGDPPPADDLLATLKTVDGSGSGLDADTLDGVQASEFLRSNTSDVTTAELGVRHGIHGDYAEGSGTGTNWGANIWSIGRNYNGSASGPSYTVNSYFGINWLRSGHTSADAAVGEGLYVFQSGNFKGGVGTAGIKTVGTVTAAGNITTQGSVTASGDVTAFSDQRVKVDITQIEDSLDKLLTLSGVTYDRTDIKTERQAGLIAQDVQKVLPEAVREVVVDGHGETRLTLNYNAVVGLLVNAVKELTERVKTLEEAYGSAN